MAADVDAMTTMASDRRRRYARYQPVFWRPAADAEQVHQLYLAQLVEDQDVISLVSEESGTIVGCRGLRRAGPHLRGVGHVWDGTQLLIKLMCIAARRSARAALGHDGL